MAREGHPRSSTDPPWILCSWGTGSRDSAAGKPQQKSEPGRSPSPRPASLNTWTEQRKPCLPDS